MNNTITYGVLACLLFLTSFSNAQDSLDTDSDYAADTLNFVFRPRLGVGTGVMTYYGEVQNYQKGFAPTVNRFGGMLYANAPITNFLNLEFSATYAKIAANERGLERNLNFESRLRMGTVMLYYNFYPFFQANRSRFHPFLGVGFTSFEFLSKTDLYDADGNEYYYWSDGSIMNLPEDDPTSPPTNAVPLQRDYTYETDLRTLNADNLGKYKEQSFAFPLTLGAEWHLSPRWDFRIAATYHFTFTDLIDNISPAGEGMREGDKNQDRLLFTSVSLSYDLMFGKQGGSAADDPDFDPEIPLYAGWDPNDFDKDGIIDALDKCAGTPLEALVDSSGCPLDTDGDGVPDYRDDEANTDIGSYVDEFGVTLTEDDIERHTRLFYDSTGYEHDFVEERTEVILKREKYAYASGGNKKAQGLEYVIVIGKERKDVAVNELHKYLGYKDYSSFTKGDTVYYTIGSYKRIEDAVALKSDLENAGIDVQDISRNNEKTEAIVSVDERVIEKVERIIEKEDYKGPEMNVPKQFYRVQLGAFSSKIDVEKEFPGLPVVFAKSDKDGLIRYYTGSFETYEEASTFKEALAEVGIEQSFVIAYEKQVRITLKEAGVQAEELPNNYSEEEELATFVEPRDTTTSEDAVFDPSRVRYRIQLAYFKDEIPVETVDVLYTIKQILPVNGEDGSTTYYSAQFDTEAARDAALIEYQKYGLEDMKPVTEYKGLFYSPAVFNTTFETE